MTHPFAKHRDHMVQKNRVSHISTRAMGGSVHDRGDESEDKALVKKMVKSSAMKHRMDGGKVAARLDRKPRAAGGRAKHKGKTVVNVNVGHPGAAMPPIPLAAGAPPGAPPMMPPRPPMAPPMAGPPGMPPGMPPGAPMMHKDGGRVKRAHGGSVKDGPTWKEGLKNGTQISGSPGKNDLKDVGRGKAITYAKGGKVAPGFTIKEGEPARGGDKLGVESSEGGGPKLRGGAEGGLARLDKIKLYGGK